MKKLLRLLVVTIVIFSIIVTANPAQKVFAQSFGTTWASSYQVLNLSDTAAATIQIYYYNQDGSLATMATPPGGSAPYSNPVQDTVNPGASNTYFPVHAQAGFNGSVVISSSGPIAVISNLVAGDINSSFGVDSYVGVSSGNPSIFFPLVMKGNSNYTSTINIQNTSSGTTATTVTVHFTPATGFATIQDATAVVKPGAAATFDLSTMSQFSSVAKWIGSATATVSNTSTDTIAGVVTTVGTANSRAIQVSTYNAFSAGSTQVLIPLVQESNNGNRTSINCQNLDQSTTTTISVEYTPAPGSPTKAPDSQANIAPNQLAYFIQDYTSAKPKFIGSARVTSNPSVQLACTVNQQSVGLGYVSTYQGFTPTSPKAQFIAPLVQSKNRASTFTGYVYTTINISTADGASHPITCNFKPAPGFNTPTAQKGSGSTVVFFQNDVFGNGTRFIGGAVCSADDGAMIYGVVNQSRESATLSPWDYLTTYNGFGQ